MGQKINTVYKAALGRKLKMKNFIHDLVHFILNHIIGHIPFWHVRKFFYLLAGMKIGKNSIILMGLYVYDPWRIVIGNNVYINENCFLDGRGGIEINDNASISLHTKVITGTHISSSDDFKYTSKKVIIGENVWTGIASIILPGVELPHGAILAAGSVAIYSKNSYCSMHIYSGVPAVDIGIRKGHADYQLGAWKPFLR